MKKLLVLLIILFVISAFYFLHKRTDETDIFDSTALLPDVSEKEFLSHISIDYLRSLNISAEKPEIVEILASGTNYKRYIASYISEGNMIYGLLTVPDEDPPEEGYNAIVFVHGYIPPSQYVTTEKYIAYVDYLASSGFVVFKIDLRGNGDSEGSPTGSYFSPGYSIDAISALKSLQKLDYVNSAGIGMWGHSMAGNAILRAMLVESDIKAGVIWAGAVYSYEDFAKYRLNDASYVRRERSDENNPHYDARELNDTFTKEVAKLRNSPEEVDYTSDFWTSISLTNNIEYLNSPLQIHHAVDDPSVNINYSMDLAKVLDDEGKVYELLEYPGGGHNIDSPYFEQAMEKTVEFFKREL